MKRFLQHPLEFRFMIIHKTLMIKTCKTLGIIVTLQNHNNIPTTFLGGLRVDECFL